MMNLRMLCRERYKIVIKNGIWIGVKVEVE